MQGAISPGRDTIDEDMIDEAMEPTDDTVAW